MVGSRWLRLDGPFHLVGGQSGRSPQHDGHGGRHYAILTETNSCLLLVAQERAGSWMPLAHGMFGMGALISPQLLRLMELEAYYCIAAIYLIFVMACFHFGSPFSMVNGPVD